MASRFAGIFPQHNTHRETEPKPNKKHTGDLPIDLRTLCANARRPTSHPLFALMPFCKMSLLGLRFWTVISHYLPLKILQNYRSVIMNFMLFFFSSYLSRG